MCVNQVHFYSLGLADKEKRVTKRKRNSSRPDEPVHARAQRPVANRFAARAGRVLLVSLAPACRELCLISRADFRLDNAACGRGDVC